MKIMLLTRRKGRGSKSREERRMDADRTRVLITLALAILALAILVWIGEGPIHRERVPEAAAQMAERVYGDVLEQWAGGRR